MKLLRSALSGMKRLLGPAAEHPAQESVPNVMNPSDERSNQVYRTPKNSNSNPRGSGPVVWSWPKSTALEVGSGSGANWIDIPAALRPESRPAGPSVQAVGVRHAALRLLTRS